MSCLIITGLGAILIGCDINEQGLFKVTELPKFKIIFILGQIRLVDIVRLGSCHFVNYSLAVRERNN